MYIYKAYNYFFDAAWFFTKRPSPKVLEKTTQDLLKSSQEEYNEEDWSITKTFVEEL